MGRAAVHVDVVSKRMGLYEHPSTSVPGVCEPTIISFWSITCGGWPSVPVEKGAAPPDHQKAVLLLAAPGAAAVVRVTPQAPVLIMGTCMHVRRPGNATWCQAVGNLLRASIL